MTNESPQARMAALLSDPFRRRVLVNCSLGIRRAMEQFPHIEWLIFEHALSEVFDWYHQNWTWDPTIPLPRPFRDLAGPYPSNDPVGVFRIDNRAILGILAIDIYTPYLTLFSQFGWDTFKTALGATLHCVHFENQWGPDVNMTIPGMVSLARDVHVRLAAMSGQDDVQPLIIPRPAKRAPELDDEEDDDLVVLRERLVKFLRIT